MWSRNCPKCGKEINYTGVWAKYGYEGALKSNACCKSCTNRIRNRKHIPIEERFWKYVVKTDGCWKWTGAKRYAGYGFLIQLDRTNISAHRLSWIIHNGQIPNEMYVCHHCDNTECTRPDHLFLGTAKDNTNDMFSKNRDWKHKGIKHPMHILTEDQVSFIKSYPVYYGSGTELAKIFNTTHKNIWKIRRGISWSHII